MANDSIDFLFNEVAANTIKKYREAANMSLEDVVSKMKNPISRQALFKYENNQARMKYSTFIDLCNVLKLDPQFIFNEINEKSRSLAVRLSEISESPNFFDILDKNGTKKTMVALANEKIKNDFLENQDKYITNNEINDSFRLDSALGKYREILDKDDRFDEEQKKFILEYLKKKEVENNTFTIDEANEMIYQNNADKLFKLIDKMYGESPDQEPDELEVLFDKHKDILTQDDRDYIKFIIEKRKKEIDKERNED